jgi:hypothetical protein
MLAKGLSNEEVSRTTSTPLDCVKTYEELLGVDQEK